MEGWKKSYLRKSNNSFQRIFITPNGVRRKRDRFIFNVFLFSKGRASITPDNVQLLYMRHNLEKSDKIR
jgi:hypothetical protein